MKPHWIRVLLLLLVVVCLAGCASFSKASARREGIAKLNLTRQGAIGCIMYADDHGGQYPSGMADLAGFFKANTNSLNQLTAGYDLVYTGAATNIAKPAETIIIREKQGWRKGGGKWLKAYAFADGHAEIHAAPDGNFEAWENEHIVKP
jgi:prepilin-type processing-associated H-X9-DG protein